MVYKRFSDLAKKNARAKPGRLKIGLEQGLPAAAAATAATISATAATATAATATVTATAATTATTTAATAAAAETSATAAALFARACFVYGQIATSNILAVEHGDCFLGVLGAAHGDEAEAA